MGVAGVLSKGTAGDDDHQGRVPGRIPGLDDGFGEARQAMLTAECRTEGKVQDVEPSGSHKVLQLLIVGRVLAMWKPPCLPQHGGVQRGDKAVTLAWLGSDKNRRTGQVRTGLDAW